MTNETDDGDTSVDDNAPTAFGNPPRIVDDREEARQLTVRVNALRHRLGLGRPNESEVLDRVAATLAELHALPPTPVDDAEFAALTPDEQERYLQSRQTVNYEKRLGILSNEHMFDSVCINLIIEHRSDGDGRLRALHRAYLDGDNRNGPSVMALYYAEAAFAVLVAHGLEPKPLKRSYRTDEPFHPTRLASNTLDFVRGFTSAPSIEDRAWVFMHASREYHRMVLALLERRVLSNTASVSPMLKQSSHYAVTGKRDRIEQWCRARVESLRAEGKPMPSARALASRALDAEREQGVEQVPGESTIRGWIREMKLLASPVSTSHEPRGSSGHSEGEPMT